MARGNLPACLRETLSHEGGYVDHPRDPGGATNMGITRDVLAVWRRRAVSKQQVKDLNLGEVTEIYEARYWRKVKGDKLPYGLDLSTFDAGVNSGPSRGIKWLQRATGAGVDGVYGPRTTSTVNLVQDMPATINRLNDARIGFMRSLKIWETFGRGWSRRVASVRAVSIAMWLRSQNVSRQSQREILEAERKAAEQAAKRRGQGAGGIAAGGGSASLWNWGDPNLWLTFGLVALILLLVAALVIRREVNRDRANAFNEQINKIKEVK